jgi:hypothetical protein
MNMHDRNNVQMIEGGCPFSAAKVCTASFSGLRIDSWKKTSCCDTEDYDNCPLFLSKILRKS